MIILVDKRTLGRTILGHLPLQRSETLPKLYFLLALSFLGLHLPEKLWVNVAITTGVLVEIFLMILLGWIEILQWHHFNSKRLRVSALNCCNNSLDYRQVSVIYIINTGAILGADIPTLTVEG